MSIVIVIIDDKGMTWGHPSVICATYTLREAATCIVVTRCNKFTL